MITVPPEGDMTVCSTLEAINPIVIYISLHNTTNVNITEALEEKSGDQVSRILHLITVNVSTKVCANHLVDVETFHSISGNFDLLVSLKERSGAHF